MRGLPLVTSILLFVPYTSVSTPWGGVDSGGFGTAGVMENAGLEQARMTAAPRAPAAARTERYPRVFIHSLWFRGGFPEARLAGDDEAAMDWIEDLITTYLERDVPQIGFQVPAARLRVFWTMLAHLQGEPVNASALAGSLEVPRSAVNHYIDILNDLFLIRRLRPRHADIKKRLVKSPRYYIRDSGIQHRLLGIDSYDDLLSSPVLGKSWEGFVVENIHSVLPLGSSVETGAGG